MNSALFFARYRQSQLRARAAADLLDEIRRDDKGRFAPGGGSEEGAGEGGGGTGMHSDDEIHRAFDYHDPVTGMTARVTGTRPMIGTENGKYVDIEITNADGDHCGGGIRTISSDGKTVSHSGLAMNPDFGAKQGQGFATRFNAQAEGVYRENGVEKITLSAGMSAGGYAWARAGFDFRNGLSRREVAQRAAKMAHEKGYSEDVRGQIRHVSDGKESTPLEFAMIGWSPGATTWPGKEIMLGSQWEGVKYLD